MGRGERQIKKAHSKTIEMTDYNKSLTTDNSKLMKTMLTIILIESLECRSGSYLTLRIGAKE